MTFGLSKEQNAKVTAWCAEQDKKVIAVQRKSDDPFVRQQALDGIAYYGAIGGVLTYCFTPTGLGVISKVKHAFTGAELDLTDYWGW